MKLLIAVGAACLISACSNHHQNIDANDQYLQNMVEDVQKDVKHIADGGSSLQREDKSVFNEVDPKLIPKILESTLNAEWHGEADIFLMSVAESFGENVSFDVIGTKPAHPQDVFINARKKTLLNILENVGHQLPMSTILNVIIDPFVSDKVDLKLIYEE